MSDESLRETIEAAMSSTPEPVAGETTTTTPAEAAPVETSGPDAGAPKPAAPARERDERGRFAPKAGEEPAKEPAAAPEGVEKAVMGKAAAADKGKAAGAEPPTAPVAAPTPEKAPDLRPPQSWKPTAREKWAGLPREVQEEAIRIDREVQKTLSETATARRAAEEFQGAARPWEHLFRSQGVSASQFLDIAARTQYTLMAGAPQQKAEVFAHLIRQSGVPIEMLDAALAGQAPTPSQPAPPPVDPADRPLTRRELQQIAAQTAAKQATARLEKFAATHEAFQDVRDRMADVLTARGVTTPTDEDLEQAYSLAVAVDPEWSKVTKQREEEKAAKARQAEMQRAKAAAVSIKPNPAVAATRSGPTTLRQDLEDAIRQSQRT